MPSSGASTRSAPARAASAQASAMRFRFSASAPTVRLSWASARRSIDSTVAADCCSGTRRRRAGLNAREHLVQAVGGLLLPVERRQAGAPVAGGRLVAHEVPDEQLRVRVVHAYECDGLTQEIGLPG